MKKIMKILFVYVCFIIISSCINVDAKIIYKDNNFYYQNEAGEIQTGFQVEDGKTYFFSNDKTRYGVMRTGIIKIGDYYYCFDNELKTGLFEYNGNKYYANEKGEMQFGAQVIDGKTYFFSNDKTRYGVMRTGMLLIGDIAYYLTPYAKTGVFEYNGNEYYANEKGEIQLGFQDVDGKTYFFSRDKKKYGAKKTGMFQVGDYYYILDPELKTGLFEYNGNNYYANEDGELQFGVQVIDGKTYFFSNDKTRYGVMRTGMVQVGDIAYYLTPYAQTGLFEYNGNEYYANEKGEIQLGFQDVDGKTYFFSRDKKKYGAKKTGMFQVGDYYYILDPELKTELFEYNGNKYYANEDGELQFGAQEIGGKTYYFSNDKTRYGVMRTGMLLIGEVAYYFTPYAQTGLFEYNGNKYYANEKGEIQLGFQKIGEKTYFFSRDKTKYGAMRTGWVTVGNDIYYFGIDGAMNTGKQTIEGRDYLFAENGILQGFKNIGNTFVYYNPDGTLALGIQRLAGRYYKFNEYTGAFEKYVNQRIVIDVSAHQGDIDWEKVKNSGMVDAVILRAGYGVSWTDDYFKRNVQELNRLGIPYTVYLFSYAENAKEAGMEADNLINIIKNNQAKIASSIFSIYYDLEDWYISSTGENSNSISKKTYEQMYNAFAGKVESATGVDVKIYASKNFIETRFPTSLKPHVGWVAQWGNEITYDGTYEGWQYTSDGSVPGINGRVDMSIFYY